MEAMFYCITSDKSTYKIPSTESVQSVNNKLQTFKKAICGWKYTPSTDRTVINIVRHDGFEKCVKCIIAVADDTRFQHLIKLNHVDECIVKFSEYLECIRQYGSLFDMWYAHEIKPVVRSAIEKVTALCG
jgi:hypothetical protein